MPGTQTKGRVGGLRQSMASLHTWAGLIPGWILFLVFLFGTGAFFNQEVSAWMRPELKGTSVSQQALEAAETKLARDAAGADSWHLSFPHPRGGEALTVSWPPLATDGEWTRVMLDSETGKEAVVRDTRGGNFLYTAHYNLHYIPYWIGRYLILIASLSMLVAIMSGVITHKKIFSDFFTLRFGKRQRSWLDAHNVTSILALPFHLMITYTGLSIFTSMLMPWVITANFPTEDAYYEAADASPGHPQKTGRAASVTSLTLIAERAQAAWGRQPASIIIEHPGDSSAVIEVEPLTDRLGRDLRALHFDGITGKLLSGSPPASSATVTQGVMVQLHAGWFAAPVLRWLYFLAGVGGTVMIVTGLVLWTVKRRAKLPDPDRPHFGFRLVERLNIGFIIGAIGGIAVYFLANRLLPLGLANRAEWEIHSLFIAWGALFVWSLGRPARRAWVETLAASAALYAMVPAISAVTTERGLIPSLLAADWVFVGFDFVMLTMASLLAMAARRMAQHKPKIAMRGPSRSPVEAAA